MNVSLTTTPAWHADAACGTEDPELFFPPDVRNLSGRRAESKEYRDHVAAALAVCARCPVKDECLQEAQEREGTVAGSARYGIFGGMTEHERAQAARIKKVTDAGVDGLTACVVCGDLIPRRPGEGPTKYRSRRACSRSCGWVLRTERKNAEVTDAGVDGLTACVVCGDLIPRRPGEGPTKYRSRRACSRSCGWVLRKERKNAEVAGE